MIPPIRPPTIASPPPKMGRTPIESPRVKITARVTAVTLKALDAERKKRGVNLGRLLDELAQELS